MLMNVMMIWCSMEMKLGPSELVTMIENYPRPIELLRHLSHLTNDGVFFETPSQLVSAIKILQFDLAHEPAKLVHMHTHTRQCRYMPYDEYNG